MPNILTELLSTCRQLNGLLKTKDPHHSQIVESLLNKVEGAVNFTNKDSEAIQKSILNKTKK
jgi:hypothetical protein